MKAIRLVETVAAVTAGLFINLLVSALPFIVLGWGLHWMLNG